MFLKNIVLIFCGLMFGGGTAAGVIALLTTLGFIPRMIGRMELEQESMHWENVILLGSVMGCLLSVFEPTPVFYDFWRSFAGVFTAEMIGQGALMLVGVCCGIYVGCQAMALAEVLNMFPIMFRRLKLQEGLPWTVLFIALGKLTGSLWYFLFGYAGGM